MDYLIISIATTVVLASVGLAFVLIPKIKTKKKNTINNSSSNNSIIGEGEIREKLNKLQHEKFKLEKLIEEKNNHIAQLHETNLDGKKSEKEKSNLQDKINELDSEISDLEKEKKEATETIQKNEEKLEKVEKENTRLEEEIDDIKDEISDLGRRNKRIKEEKNGLDDKIYCLEKENKEIFDINKLNEEKLDKSEKENTKQKESLDFVSDILNANNATNEEFKKIDLKTWDIFSFIENDLIYGLSNLDNNIIDDDYLYKCWNWRNQEIKTWIKDKKVVAIVGEFSAGKTSIVNRILKQDDPNAIELPVRSKETTAIPTYISKGIDFNCQFYSQSGDLKNISSTSFQKVTKSVLDDVNISSLVKYFVLSYNNENLSDISILDTPGFGSNSEGIISKTADVVKEADALFWVIDANSGELNSSSVKVIKDNLQDVPLYIIINKTDNKSPQDLEITQNKIEDTLNKNNISYIQMIFFSQEKEIEELMTILNSITPKENPNIVTDLKNQIDTTLTKARNQLKELKTEESDLRNNEDSQLQNLRDLMLDIDHSVEDMERVIEFEIPFFGKDYYKISQDNYRGFANGMKKIVKSNDELPYSIDEFINILNSYSDKKEEVYMKKRDIKNLEDSKRTFEKFIYEYDQLQKTRNPKIIN